MNIFLQRLVVGISTGSVYTLLTVGYALVFSVFNLSSFGFGPVMMLGAFAVLYAIPALNLPLFLSILLVMVVAGIMSFIMELMVRRPMRQKRTLRLYLIIAGFGISTFVPNAAIQIFGGGIHAFPPGWACVTIQMGGVVIPRSDILAAVLSILILAGLWMLFYNIRIGLGIRASSFDTNTASLMGINVNLVAIIVFLLSGAATGFAGCFYSMKYSIFPSMGAIANRGFVTATINNLGGLISAVISGLLLRFLETVIADYASSIYHDLVVHAILAIVLIFTFNGILGKGVHDKI